MKMRDLFEPKMRESVITIPNIITFLGIITVGFYTYGFLTGSRWLLGIMLFLAGLSDMLDGIAAWKLQQKTRLGEFLDPFRDRLLLLAVLANIFYIDGIKCIFWGGMMVCYELLIVVCNFGLFPSKRKKVHIVGKLRQAAHLLLAGLVVLSFYFKDILHSVVNISFHFSSDLALPLMAACSCIALFFYVFSAKIIDKKIISHHKC